jgi:hypothetical protein
MNPQQPFALVRYSRRDALILASVSLFTSPRVTMAAAQAGTEEKFSYLSKNGNSSCSTQFRDSILTMSSSTRIQGSCCGPMALHHYKEQVQSLKEYANFPEIPPDPYDIDPGFAAIMLNEYKVELNRVDLAKYNTAMELSAEGGPCCCKCWRWEILGGMGKVLIRDRQIDSKTLAKLWDLTNGCGGDAHVH